MNMDKKQQRLFRARERILQIAATALIAGSALAMPAAPARAASAAQVDHDRLVNAGKEPGSWLTRGGTTDEHHYSPLDAINDKNIDRLGLAWYGEFDTNRGQEATPLVIDGVLYTSTAWSKVYAYDARTGKQLWFFDPEVPGKKGPDGCCDVVNRGVAAWNGKIFVGTYDGRLVAIDAKTGTRVWETQTTDTTKNYTITGAPRVVKGKVLIGNGGAEFGVRGYVSAYDAETGKLAWRFYITPNPENKPDGAASDEILMSLAYETWGDGAWRQTGGGGTAWDAIVYDKDFDQVLIGTGNGTPWSHRARSGGVGDNLFISSIVAVDADSGKYKWHYQSTPAEEWDFTATQPIVLADLDIDGKPTKVAMQAPKNGFFYVLDRSDGKLISARNYTPINWATGIDMATGRPIEYPAARYSVHGNDFIARPGAFGSHNWPPMAYSPVTGLVYIPSQQGAFGYKDDKNYKFVDLHGAWNLANATTQAVMAPRDEAERLALTSMFRGDLIAWDPVQQKEVWKVEYPSIGAGGTLATAGNLVFQGTPDGTLYAYSADKGETVWSFDGQVGIIAAPMSYTVGDEQYIAVLSGLGGSAGLQIPHMKNPRSGRGRVLVFNLGGTTKLPPYERSRRPAMVPTDRFTDEQVAHGASLYGNCVACHGYGTYTNDEVVPDLRRSPMILNKESFASIVLDGILEAKGMVSFADRLTPEDTEALRAYLANRAAQLKADDDAEARARAAGNPASKANP